MKLGESSGGSELKAGMQQDRISCVFVGAFGGVLEHGVTGGQVRACVSLIASDISRHIDWYKIDTTQESIPPPGIVRRAWLAIKRLWKFFFVTSRRRPDSALIFAADGLSFLEKGLMTLWARQLRITTVLCPRSGIIIDDVKRGGWRRRFIEIVLRNSSVVVCQSQFWRSFFCDLVGGEASQFVVIPNWISLAESKAKELPAEQAGPVRVLFLGWVDRNKGIFDLLDAISERRSELEVARFEICGGGADLAEAKTQTERDSIESLVTFRGWVDGEEKAQILGKCSMLVLPSHREGFPNALLEAMAAGLAVVATRVGAVGDIIEDERTGLIVDAQNVRGIGDALVRLVNDRGLRERLGGAGREKVYDQHNIKNIWPYLLELLRGETDQVGNRNDSCVE